MNNHSLRRTGALLLLVLFSGCLPFPLGDPDKSQVDPKLGGFWAADSGDQQRELIALYPFDQHTYVLEDQKLKKQEDKWQPDGPALVFKAWLTSVKGQQFITLEPLQQRLATSADQKAYPVLRLTSQKDGMQVRPVSADFEPIKKSKSSADIEAVIAKELDNPDLYQGDGSIFHRLDAEKHKELIQLVAPS